MDRESIQNANHSVTIQTEDASRADTIALDAVIEEGLQGELVVVATVLSEFVKTIEDYFGVGL